MSFASLGLAEPIVRAVTELGYTQPTPIQTQAIPAVLAGSDLLAGAQTGTGKTAGFVLPMLHRLAQSAPVKGPGGRFPIRALILTPTRELAAQVEESVRDYGKHLKLTSLTIFGGVNINPQIEKLRGRVDILVATPGRLLDHAGQRTVDLSGVEILVLDEADRMLDMGFVRDVRKVLALLPRKRQNLLFSATFSDEIRSLANEFLSAPKTIEVARRNAPAEAVSQRVIQVDKPRKRELLSKLIKDHHWFQVLVFTRTKHGANRLAEQLNRDGITALAIHGNKSQGARTRALSEFKDGTLQALVATDIAARGLDIEELPHVVNFELPNVPEDYVHRIGRTGRAGASGEALSLVCVDELKFLADIERLIKRPLPRESVPGFEHDPTIRAVPIPMGRTGRGQQYDDGLGESLAPRQVRGQPRGGDRRHGHGHGQPAHGPHGAHGQGRSGAGAGKSGSRGQTHAGSAQRGSQGSHAGQGQARSAQQPQRPAQGPQPQQRPALQAMRDPRGVAPATATQSAREPIAPARNGAQAAPARSDTGNGALAQALVRTGFRGTTRVRGR